MGRLFDKNDIVGKKFDDYTVLSCIKDSNPLEYMVKCKCGVERKMLRNNLLKNRHKFCRCANNSENIAGQRFGRLVAVELVRSEGEKRFWKCDCDCGETYVVNKVGLKSGHTRSCGCLFNDTVVASLTKHGHASRDKASRTYKCYHSMKSRCTSPSHENNKVYKDISVCSRWLESFENFLEDMGEAPTEKHEIDRIDPEKDYYKENCRWVTKKQNCYNKRGKKNTTSQYKGVSFDSTRKRNKRWKAQLTINGKKVFEGRYITEVEAAKAYNEKALIYYGEYAYINKIEGEVEQELDQEEEKEVEEEFID